MEHPTAFVKYHKGFDALLEKLEEPDFDDKQFQPRPWQHRLLSLLAVPPDDRTIIWVHEPTGNVGKSRLVRHLLIEHKAKFLSGKLADMCTNYKREKIVCFNITRAAAEFSDHCYTMAEWLKDGFFQKSKWHSCDYIFNPPHVVFFSNSLPDFTGKWSEDRVKIVDLQDPTFHLPAIRQYAARGRFSNSGRIARAAAEESD